MPLLRFVFGLIVVGLAFVAATAARASGVSSTETFAPTVALTPPPVTGSFADLQAPGWHGALHASSFENFTVRRPDPEATDAYVVFGPDAVYCAFVSVQIETIKATQTTDNVGLGLDDYVALMFDTSGNGSNQYFFETTPGGVRYQQASESSRYAPPWTARAKAEEGRWLGEFVIPYRYLRGSSRTWRINFARYVAGSQQLFTWAYEPQMGSPFSPSFWPSVTGAPALAANVARPEISLYGLLTGGRDRRIFESAAGQFASAGGRAYGLDAKIPVTGSLNFDATLAPDFSGLENDQQTIAPQEFRYQYSEYRPFFTQGANDLPSSEVFYSPSVGTFDEGEKLEGQVGNVALGALNVGTFGASDRAFAATYNAPNQETSAGISGAQAIRSGSGDSVVEISASNTVHASQVYTSAAIALDADAAVTAASLAMRDALSAGVAKPNYSIYGSYYAIGPEYHPTDAYVAQNDIRGPQLSASLNSTTDATAAVRYLSISGYADRYLDDSNAVREADVGLGGTITFKDLLSLSLGQSTSSLRSYERAYPFYLGGVTEPYDQSTISASYRSGTPDTESLSYSWGPYQSEDLQQLNGSISHRLSSRYSAEVDYGQVLERNLIGAQNGQVIERITLYGTLSSGQTLALALREIEGTGGYATPGSNLALDYFRRFGKGNTLQAEFGSPAAPRTLERFALKYVLLIGSGAAE